MVIDGERALQRQVGRLFEGVTLVLDLLHRSGEALEGRVCLPPRGQARGRGLRPPAGGAHLERPGQPGGQGAAPDGDQASAHRRQGQDPPGGGRLLLRQPQPHGLQPHLEAGWPIASASVEGACKNLARDRMERSGMRWSPLMAEAMLKLHAVYLSSNFDPYWTWHIERDHQQRLYPKDHWRFVLK
jgi:hypothetical protein